MERESVKKQPVLNRWECANCSLPEQEGVRLRPCSRCKLVRYCGTDCQAQHWKKGGHKKYCVPPEQRKPQPCREISGQRCAICLEAYDKETCQTLACSHEFHVACIQEALRSSGFCPTCRATIAHECTNATGLAERSESESGKAKPLSDGTVSSLLYDIRSHVSDSGSLRSRLKSLYEILMHDSTQNTRGEEVYAAATVRVTMTSTLTVANSTVCFLNANGTAVISEILQMHITDFNICFMCCACLAYLNCDRDDEQFMTQITASRCHCSVLSTLYNHGHDAEFVRCCCNAAICTFDPAQKSQLVVKGYLDTLLSVAVAISDNPSILGTMCNVLALYSMRDAEVSIELVRHRFIGSLVAALKKHEQHTILCSLGTYLLCVLGTSGHDVQCAIVDAGGLRVITSVCRLHPEHEAFVSACTALATISTGNDYIKKCIVESGALLPVIDALRSVSALSDIASTFLGNMSSGGMNIVDAMYEAGCAVPLIGLINVSTVVAGHSSVNACIAVGNMAEQSKVAKLGFIAKGAIVALQVASKAGNRQADHALSILKTAEK